MTPRSQVRQEELEGDMQMPGLLWGVLQWDSMGWMVRRRPPPFHLSASQLTPFFALASCLVAHMIKQPLLVQPLNPTVSLPLSKIQPNFVLLSFSSPLVPMSSGPSVSSETQARQRGAGVLLNDDIMRPSKPSRHALTMLQ